MEMSDRIRAIMKKEFGIVTDDQLEEAVDLLENNALGIFALPVEEIMQDAG